MQAVTVPNGKRRSGEDFVPAGFPPPPLFGILVLCLLVFIFDLLYVIHFLTFYSCSGEGCSVWHTV